MRIVDRETCSRTRFTEGQIVKMTELTFDGEQPPIDGYAPGGFRVRGQFFEGPLMIGAQGVISWAVSAGAMLDAAAAEAALSGPVGDGLDLLVLGCGAVMTPPPRAFRDVLEQRGIGLEFMASPTACRTYNVLLSEDRRVAAALLPV